MLKNLLIVALCFSALPLVQAADKKGEAAPKDVHSKLSDAKKTCGAACTVNFSKELGVPLEYLTSIGHRISVARRSPDPVELAMAANSLSVAEKVSNKKASITSDSVMAEALQLAKLRGISSELQALALVTSNDATKKDLEKQATIAKKREDEAKATSPDEAAKELIGTLTVANHTGECLRIYIGGQYVGTVHEGRTASFRAHDHNNPTELDAYCEDGDLVSHQHVYGHRHSFFWHIH